MGAKGWGKNVGRGGGRGVEEQRSVRRREGRNDGGGEGNNVRGDVKGEIAGLRRVTEGDRGRQRMSVQMHSSSCILHSFAIDIPVWNQKLKVCPSLAFLSKYPATYLDNSNSWKVVNSLRPY
ncbi:hypothetical protein PoB_005272000 [Plakobranchus ocellatus]|uniref:Uncharacterized protein n=1 Tax=Plakobranchus ocellatus TaxID=259542 RepID=A0AAV4C0N2_9GAST|nr:hypothetical protein PoB_005272000 [Plakobranchus ocellatus]